MEGLAHASKKALKDIKGLSEQKVEKLKAAGVFCLPSTKFGPAAFELSQVHAVNVPPSIYN